MVGCALFFIFALSLTATPGTATIPLPEEELDVPYPPHITQPQNQALKYITEGLSETLQCKASGKPRPRLEWRFNGDLIVSYKSSRMTEFPDNGTLVLTRFDASMEGYYQCFAKNNYGVSLSQMVEIRQRLYPTFTNQGDANNVKKVAEGEGLKLECSEKPTNGRPQGSYDWYHVTESGKNEQIHTHRNDRYDMDLNGTFYIIEAKPEDTSQTYACAVSTTNPVKVSIAKTPYVAVEVTTRKRDEFAPVLLGSSDDLTADIGGKVTLECFFSGQPRPKIVWRDSNNRRIVNGSENGRVFITSSSHKVILSRVRDEDEGQFTCEANNTLGSLSAIISLNVTSRPLMKARSPGRLVSTVGSDPTFRCLAQGARGEAPLSIPHWTVNGNPLRKNDSKFLLSDDGRDLTVSDVTKTDMVCVQCNVSNSQGYAFGDGFLIVIDPLLIVSRPNNTIEIEQKVHAKKKEEGAGTGGQEGEKVKEGENEGEEQGEISTKEVNMTIVAKSDPCCPLNFAWTFKGEDVPLKPPFTYVKQASPEGDFRVTLTLKLSGDPKRDGPWMGEYRCDVWHFAYAANDSVKVALKFKKVMVEPEKKVQEAGFKLWWVLLLAGILVLIAAAVIIFLMVHFNYPRQAYLLEKEERKHHLDPHKDLLDHSFEEI